MLSGRSFSKPTGETALEPETALSAYLLTVETVFHLELLIGSTKALMLGRLS